jgi:FHA domain-containing protein
MIEIYVLTFADLALDKPQSMVFSDNGGSIGRSQENTMILLDSERLISRVQAQIYKLEESYVIENLSSTSAIFVGDTELGKRERAALSPITEIRIGLYVLGVRFIEKPKQEKITAITAITATNATNAIIAPEPVIRSTSETRVKGIPIDDPLSLFGSSGSSTIGNPFEDLIVAPATNIPAELASNFSGFESNVPELAKEVAYKKMPVTIPEDFNAFSLPSQVKRNTENPLKELDKNNSISLKGIYEINETTDRLVDHGVLRYDLNANDLHKDESAKMFSSMLNVDPMAMFDNAPSLLPSNNSTPQYTLPNHGSELKASFTKPQNKTTPTNNGASQNIDSILSEINIVDANRLPESTIKNSPDLLIKVVSNEVKPSAPLLGNQIGFESNSDKSSTVNSVVTEKNNAAETKILHILNSSVSASASASANANANASLKSIQPTAKKVNVDTITPNAEIPLSDDLLQAFLLGAGVAGTPLIHQLDAALMTKLGQMLQICVSGAVDLIQARAATKREFRSEVTMIVTKGNNPLKFSPDGQAAMLQLLGKPFPGFIPAVPALQDTFDDLRAHEVGMIVGTRAALHEVLNRFSPDELEKRLTTPTLMQTILPSQRKAHLWRMYNELFQKIFDEAENDFQTLYGKAFRDAYEDEVERLKSNIKE